MRVDHILFCEAVRQERSGQLTIVGLFATDHVVGPPDHPEANGLALPLCALIVFDHMQGVSQFELQVTVTKGAQAVHTFPPAVVRRSDASEKMHAHLQQFGVLVMPGAGDYHFNFLVSAHGDVIRFTRRFTVRQSRPSATRLN